MRLMRQEMLIQCVNKRFGARVAQLHERVTKFTLVLTENKKLTRMECDIEAPGFTWSLLWFCAPTEENLSFENNGTTGEQYDPSTNVAVQEAIPFRFTRTRTPRDILLYTIRTKWCFFLVREVTRDEICDG